MHLLPVITLIDQIEPGTITENHEEAQDNIGQVDLPNLVTTTVSLQEKRFGSLSSLMWGLTFFSVDGLSRVSTSLSPGTRLDIVGVYPYWRSALDLCRA